MSVQSEIDRIITAVGNAYSKVSEKGGTVPASQTVSNLATAIDSIPEDSAYQAAVEGGYSGTETEFNSALANVPGHIENSDIHVTAEEKAAWSESDVFIAKYGTTTSAEIEAAYQAGKAVYCLDKSTTPIGFYSLTRISTSGHLANFDVAIGQDLSDFGVGKTVQAIRISCTQGTWNTTKYAAATSEHASAHATGGSDPITPASIGAAPISTTTEVTLAAASWSGDSAPYTYTLTVNGVTDTSTQEIVFAASINLEQLTAGQNANIQDGGQSANTIVLKAWGEKPTVDLPIRVIMRG